MSRPRKAEQASWKVVIYPDALLAKSLNHMEAQGYQPVEWTFLYKPDGKIAALRVVGRLKPGR